jgi:activator of HSP90 ATPase
MLRCHLSKQICARSGFKMSPEAIMANEKFQPIYFDTVTRRQVLMGAASVVGGIMLTASRTQAADVVTHTGEVIHQEVVFNASVERVYSALTDAAQFDKVMHLSAAMQSGMALGNKPTQISHKAGGTFCVFGGHIVGRQIELVADKRIVQAWRVADWSPGMYSIAKFDLATQDSQTRLFFDHTGFPEGQGQHLAEGWQANYWEPLRKYLA